MFFYAVVLVRAAYAHDAGDATRDGTLPFPELTDFGALSVTAQPVTERVVLITDPDGRIGGIVGAYLGDGGVVLVDSAYPQAAARVDDVLRGLDAAPVRLVINTHWHVDHTDANVYWAEQGARIVATDAVRRRRTVMQEIRLFGRSYDPLPNAGLPSITYVDRLTLRLFGQTLHVRESNGHTDGDSIVHFVEENAFHLGDLSFGRQYPFLDVDTGGTWQGLIDSITWVLARSNDESRYIPGHLLPGDPRPPYLDRSELEEYLAMLTTVHNRVADAKARGLTLDEAVAADLLADLDPDWQRSPLVTSDLVVETVYRTLGRP